MLFLILLLLSLKFCVNVPEEKVNVSREGEVRKGGMHMVVGVCRLETPQTLLFLLCFSELSQN